MFVNAVSTLHEFIVTENLTHWLFQVQAFTAVLSEGACYQACSNTTSSSNILYPVFTYNPPGNNCYCKFGVAPNNWLGFQTTDIFISNLVGNCALFSNLSKLKTKFHILPLFVY